MHLGLCRMPVAPTLFLPTGGGLYRSHGPATGEIGQKVQSRAQYLS